MKPTACCLLLALLLSQPGMAQVATPTRAPRPATTRDPMQGAAMAFLNSLSPEQRKLATYGFDDAERVNWHFVPRARNGLTMKQMTTEQRQAALALLRTGLSDEGYRKATQIMDLENVLRVVENRPLNDTYRDPDNYSVTIFGDPAGRDPWGWRVEGHHVSLHFSSMTGKVVGSTPLFFGSNPGHVRADMPQKGRQVLRQETELATKLLASLTDAQRIRAVLRADAFPDILTGNSRRALMEKMEGISAAEMTAPQRQLFLELLQNYLNNYRQSLASQQFERVTRGGLDSLRFAWAGDLKPVLGDAADTKTTGWYYRIHGPTLLIEYDNTQTQANHVHTVVRDLTNDFGEDLLRAHYEQQHK